MEDLQTDLDKLEQALQLLFQHLKKHATWNELTTQAGVKIDRPSAGILHMLIHYQKPSCTLNDLADMLGVEAPSVTRKTQELERMGLVKRSRSDSDRRSVYIEVTDQAREIEDRINQARREAAESVLKNWTKSERQQFISLFSRYANDLTDQSEHQTKLNREVN